AILLPQMIAVRTLQVANDAPLQPAPDGNAAVRIERDLEVYQDRRAVGLHQDILGLAEIVVGNALAMNLGERCLQAGEELGVHARVLDELAQVFARDELA